MLYNTQTPTARTNKYLPGTQSKDNISLGPDIYLTDVGADCPSICVHAWLALHEVYGCVEYIGVDRIEAGHEICRAAAEATIVVAAAAAAVVQKVSRTYRYPQQ